MVEICALASGSNGNSYYIGNENEAVLIDAGIYYKRLVERMEEAGLDIKKVKAVFISHEHADHVQGIRVTTKKLGVPGIYSQHTYFKANRKYRSDLYAFFKSGEPYTIGGISVTPFKKQHDAGDPHSFSVECGGKTIGVLTDVGIADDTVIEEFSKFDAVFLESNYDKKMLWAGSYPYYLKSRVDSEIGHLSNEQAMDLVKYFASENLTDIFLSHISHNNNTQEKAMEAFNCFNGSYNIRLTSRQGISEVVCL